jgi:hypothetical protein
MAALLPAALVLKHAAYLTTTERDPVSRGVGAAPEHSAPEHSMMMSAMVERGIRRVVWTYPSIVVRFGIPALLLFGTTVVVGYAAIDPPSNPISGAALDPNVVEGGRLGAVGAYLFAVLYLARRNLVAQPGAGVAWTVAWGGGDAGARLSK